MTLTSEEDKIISFVREFYRQNGEVPSARRICREVNWSPPKLYDRFGSMESICEKADIKIDKRMKNRLKISRKATRKRSKKSVRKHVQNEQTPPVVKSVNDEPAQMSAFEKIEQAREDAEAAHDTIVENAQRFAEELKTLVLGTTDQVSVEVNTAVLEALGEVVPVVLFYKYGIMADIPDLLSAKDVLKKVKKEQKKLRKEQIQLDGERLEIQRGWEELKRSSDKAALLEHVQKLEWQVKVKTDHFNEAYEVLKRGRVVFRELWSVASKCPNCPSTFVRNMMASHGDILEWLTSGKYHMRLSFESEGTPNLGHQT